MSVAENRAWTALRRLRREDVHVVRQHRIGRYVVDFAIRKARIAIEIDGGVHDLPGRREADAIRQCATARMGWRVIRASAHMAESEDQLLDFVRAALPPAALSTPKIKRSERRTRNTRVLPPRAPSPGGEGVRGWGEALPSKDRS